MNALVGKVAVHKTGAVPSLESLAEVDLSGPLHTRAAIKLRFQRSSNRLLQRKQSSSDPAVFLSKHWNYVRMLLPRTSIGTKCIVLTPLLSLIHI